MNAGFERAAAEVTERFGITFVSEKKEPYSYYRGRTVEIFSNGIKVTGVYIGLSGDESDGLVVYPCLETQFYPDSSHVQNGNNNGIKHYRWSELPATITRVGVSIMPIEESYIEKLIRQSEEVPILSKEKDNTEESFGKWGSKIGTITLFDAAAA